MTYGGGLTQGCTSIEEVKAVGLAEGELIVKAAAAVEAAGIPCPERNAGSTPTAPFAASVPGVTEIRCGNYVFHDVGRMALGVATIEDCALSVICTVVARPAPDRVIIDGGSKTFTSDLAKGGSKTFGYIKNEPDLIFEKLNEEHGIIRVPAGYREIKIGEKLEIIPNHACVIPNLTEYLYVSRGDNIIAKWPVLCRGKSI
jgi:D-serine deaminase-like pyridoxal phosphate-dependent protein